MKQKTGTNEKISAMIVRDGAVKYYGVLGAAQSGTNKTVTVNLAGKYSDGDTLYVFNEQSNADGLMEKDVTITVKTGFLAKLKAFFQSLFGLLPKVELKP